MPDLLIRDLPAVTHAELKRRAASAGMSLQGYVARLLEAQTSQPSVDEWLERLEQLPRHRAISGAETIRAAREEPR